MAEPLSRHIHAVIDGRLELQSEVKDFCMCRIHDQKDHDETVQEVYVDDTHRPYMWLDTEGDEPAVIVVSFYKCKECGRTNQYNRRFVFEKEEIIRNV